MRTLAGRYSLQDRVLDGPGWSYWRGQDAVLNRAVGVLVLAAGDPREAALTEAARRSSGAEDPRVQRVLDVLDDADNTCLIFEWLAGSTGLEEELADGPLADAQSRQLVLELARALAAIDRSGLDHGGLAPRWVIRTDSGRVRLLGVAIAPVLAGRHTSDAVGLGQLLYSCLTGRWPGAAADSALPAAPMQGGRPVRPGMIRAGVPAALDDIVARALTLGSRGPALVTAAQVAAALELVPQGSADPLRFRLDVAEPVRPPSGRGRRAAAVVGVIALVAAASVATNLSINAARPNAAQPPTTTATPTSSTPSPGSPVVGLTALPILSVNDFDPLPAGNGSENPDLVPLAHDGNPATAWTTLVYTRPDCGGLKPGVGLVVDLGLTTNVRAVRLTLVGRGTTVEVRASSTRPVRADDAIAVASATSAGGLVTLPLEPAVRARYLVIWLTILPSSGSGYRGGISEIQIFNG